MYKSCVYNQPRRTYPRTLFSRAHHWCPRGHTSSRSACQCGDNVTRHHGPEGESHHTVADYLSRLSIPERAQRAHFRVSVTTRHPFAGVGAHRSFGVEPARRYTPQTHNRNGVLAARVPQLRGACACKFGSRWWRDCSSTQIRSPMCRRTTPPRISRPSCAFRPRLKIVLQSVSAC
jgi:hypothetical protein